MTTEAGRRAEQIRLDDVVDAALAGVARAIQTHGPAPGQPPIYVGIVAARPELGGAQAPAAVRPPTFVGIVAEGVQVRPRPQGAGAEAQVPGLPRHTFVGIQVETFNSKDEQELQQALTNVQQQLQ